jgi:putative copper export protein
MALHHFILILHLIAATIWVGGHLTLCIIFLPEALRKKDPSIILKFERQFEPLGMSALLTLAVSGIWMAYDFGITLGTWFSFSGGFEKVVSIKLLLLFLTIICALIAQFRIIPNLNQYNLNKMAVLIITVTLIGVTMLILGSTFRYGGL